MKASKEQGFDYSFHFFNRYAGHIYPATATDAFCALHKGMDAADTAAYPEAEFGKASHENFDRMLKICATTPSMARPLTTRKPSRWGKSDNGAIKPDSMTLAGTSGRTTTAGCFTRSTLMPTPSRCGASAVPSPRPPPSIPDLRAASSTPLARMRCISSCMTASPKTPSPKSCRSPSSGMTDRQAPPGSSITMPAPRP